MNVKELHSEIEKVLYYWDYEMSGDIEEATREEIIQYYEANRINDSLKKRNSLKTVLYPEDNIPFQAYKYSRCSKFGKAAIEFGIKLVEDKAPCLATLNSREDKQALVRYLNDLKNYTPVYRPVECNVEWKTIEW